MAHLSDDTLYIQAFDGRALSAEESAHLAACAECQARLAAVGDLALSLAVARISQPSAEQRARLYALAAEVQTSSAAQRLVGWVRAQLTMDTRMRTVAGGVRGAESTYRLLYSTPTLDVELMVEPAQGARSFLGALLPYGQDHGLAGALVQLDDGKEAPLETETTADGRFAIANVPPGRYELRIVRSHAPGVVLEALEIS